MSDAPHLPPSSHTAATAPERAARSKFTCRACGGEAVWNPAKQKLLCAYCGTEADLPPEDERPAGLQTSDIREHDLLAALARHTGSAPRRERLIRCQHCQAISYFDAGKQAKNCDFCGASALVEHDDDDGSIRPESVLPIQISEPRARDLIRAWYGKLWWAPNKLKSRALTDTTHGVYLPYWTFDAQADARWRADAGYYYYVTVTDSQGNQRREQRVNWKPASGQLRHFFDDVLVCGSRGVHRGLLRQVEPFPTTEGGSGALRPYDPAYLSGWTVERYQVDLPVAAERGRQIMDDQLRQLCARQVPGDTHRNLQVVADYSGQTFKHILAPVWLMTYTYGGRDFQVIINAITGQIAGEYPKSWVKITLAVIAALIVLIIILGNSG